MAMENGELVRLDKLEDHAAKTEGRLSAIEGTQNDHTRKLDAIGANLHNLTVALTKHDARPVFNLSGFISNARDIFAIIAVCAGFGVWYVTTLTEKSDALLAKDNEILAIKLQHTQDKLQWVFDRMRWTPSLEAVRPGQ